MSVSEQGWNKNRTEERERKREEEEEEDPVEFLREFALERIARSFYSPASFDWLYRAGFSSS